ncbi:MAG: phosphatidate cytidylyltransferase [Bacteroidales bacterium]
MKLYNLLTRSISGMIFVAVIITALISAWYIWAILMIIFGFLASLEFARLLQKSGLIVFPFAAATCTPFFVAFVFLVLALNKIHFILWIVLVIPFVLLFITAALKPNGKKSILPNFMSASYVAFPLSMTAILLWVPTQISFVNMNFSLFSHYYHPEFLLSALILIWVFDSFAYLTGRLLGKHKMVPRISPRKTWEGFFGGVIFLFPAVWFLNRTWDLLTNPQWLGVIIIVAVFGTLGDLLISQLKRMAGEKNSGNLIPGHGGILDRLDSLLMIIPFLTLYVIMIVL